MKMKISKIYFVDTWNKVGTAPRRDLEKCTDKTERGEPKARTGMNIQHFLMRACVKTITIYYAIHLCLLSPALISLQTPTVP